MRRNINRMARYAADHQLNLRPHTKTHKCIEFASMQMASGASGLTVAKLGEAVLMAGAATDLLIAYPCADVFRATAAADLAHRATVRVAIDNVAALEALAHAARSAGSVVGILVDVDVGMHRTGTQSIDSALKLAVQVMREGGLRLDGLFCYPGHIWHPVADQQSPLTAVAERLQHTVDAFRRAGLNTAIISGGSTPTAFQSHLIGALTEIRPGTYIFNDMNTVAGGFCGTEDCAMNVCCTVVSDAVPDKLVIDAGTKTLTSDRNIPSPDSGHGHVVGLPHAKVIRLSEEHGEIDVSRCRHRPRVGERVAVIPNHVCPCINLQDQVWLAGDTGTLRPISVDARGRLS
jgi:D-serine deaminase-like pyridoxal phosphate-dependent protein